MQLYDFNQCKNFDPVRVSCICRRSSLRVSTLQFFSSQMRCSAWKKKGEVNPHLLCLFEFCKKIPDLVAWYKQEHKWTVPEACTSRIVVVVVVVINNNNNYYYFSDLASVGLYRIRHVLILGSSKVCVDEHRLQAIVFIKFAIQTEELTPMIVYF